MRRLQRLSLSSEALAFLGKRNADVANNANPNSKVDQLWKLQSNKAFQEIRRTLEIMASGIVRCMYCEDSKGTAIDHFWPKATYPDRAFVWANYVLACSECNNKKSKRFPLDAQNLPLLLNPLEEEPADHLLLSPTTGIYETLTPKGEQSDQVYGLARPTLVQGRKNTWAVLTHLIANYSRHLAAGDAAEAARLKDAVKQLPHSGVFAALLRIAKGPSAKILLGEECLQVLQDHPEIESWL